MSALLSTSYRKHITWNGYPADVVKSGLQKYIRRSVLEKALYCAAELDLFKEAENTKEAEGIRTNFLHRLMIIFMEDVENLALFDTIHAKMNLLFQERDKEDRHKEKELYWITEVVTLLVRSKKSRMCSHVRALFSTKYEPLHESYPSMAPLWTALREAPKEASLEVHCSLFTRYMREKNLMAVYHAFQIELSEEKLPYKLFRSSKPVWFIFHQLMNPLAPVKTERVRKFAEWYKEHIGGMKEGFMCWLLPLLHELEVIPLGEEDEEQIPSYRAANREGHTITMDDYVLDRHTSRGRGKSLVEFAMVGALVEPQAEFVNEMWKRFYEDGKRLEDAVEILGEAAAAASASASASDSAPASAEPRRIRRPLHCHENLNSETDAYEFLVRTQLTTMGNKQDVYFAKDRNGKVVVVKGPFYSRAELDVLERNTAWKRQHDLPYNAFEVVRLLPNRWMEGVPLGARNKVCRTSLAYFVVFDSYLKEEDLKTKMHSSTVWPPTEVVDWAQIPFHFTYKERPLTEQEYIDYVHGILFRYLLGISDLADRNFLMTGGRVISIDEDVEGRVMDLYATLQKNKASFVHKWLQTGYESLSVSTWTVSDAFQQDRLDEIQSKDRCVSLFLPHD
jgi:hypothetical protein